MIIVTGGARCGTSLMMLTMKTLGVPVLAPQFLDEKDTSLTGLHNKFRKVYLEANKDGYFEYGMPKKDINLYEHADEAIKVLGYDLYMYDTRNKNLAIGMVARKPWVPPELVKRVVICHRKLKNILKSYWKVARKVGETVDEELVAKKIELSWMAAANYVTEFRLPHMIVKYEDMIKDTQNIVCSIARFVGCFDGDMIRQAIGNVRGKKK